jgi:hypothetical protein
MKPLPSKVQEWIDKKFGNESTAVSYGQVQGAEYMAHHLMQVIRLQGEALEIYSSARVLHAGDDGTKYAKQALTQTREIIGDE